MQNFGQLLTETRKKKKISFKKASEDLLIKKERLEALEKSEWEKLPEPAFVKGFLKSYAQYLSLDPEYILALYRREYDERDYPQEESPLKQEKRLMLTPNKVATLIFLTTVIALATYFFIQYLSILSAPHLNVFTPEDDITTNIQIVNVTGKTDNDTTVSINGNFVSVGTDGNFAYQLELTEGRNQIEIIASKRLSPKSKVIRLIRLSR